MTTYRDVLELGRYDVVEYELFGGFQGTWVALLGDGRVAMGGYGSCSGCDELEAIKICYDPIPNEMLLELIKYFTFYDNINEAIIGSKWDCESLEIHNWLNERKGQHE